MFPKDNITQPTRRVQAIKRLEPHRGVGDGPHTVEGQQQVMWVCPCGWDNVEEGRSSGGTFECYACERKVEVTL